jgi:uncharacterized protein DUF6298
MGYVGQPYSEADDHTGENRINKTPLAILMFLAGPLVALLAGDDCPAFPPPPPTGKGIEADGMYWKYNGKQVLLLGGMAYGEPHLTPKADLIRELDKLKAAGGNYMRATMAVYTNTPVQGVYPFVKRSAGKYDLSKPNPIFWEYVRTLYAETQKRGMIVQVELWDHWSQYRGNWRKNPWNPKNNINYTTSATGIPEV